MAYKFETIVYADVSTGYITPEDGELIGHRDAPGHVACVDSIDETSDDSPGDYFVVPSDSEIFRDQIEDFRMSGFSEQFVKIFEELHAQGITYVRFDIDGGEIEGAEKEDW